jgi:hypothetical protein
MKSTLSVIVALGFSCSMIQAQEQPLTKWSTQDGQNVQVGQLACPLAVQGLTIRDSSGDLTASIPLLTAPASFPTTTQFADTLYALIRPPDESGQATALIMYQADSSTSDEVSKAVQDALNHNNWFKATFAVRNINPGELLPAGTEFWVCSSTGFVTFTDSGAISLAGPPAPVADAADPGITGLLSLTNSTTSTDTSTTTP